MSDHPEYVKRMLSEYRELKPRIQKLSEFLAGPVFKTLDQADQVLMHVQRNAMEIYVVTLGQRLLNVLSRLEDNPQKIMDTCTHAVLEQVDNPTKDPENA